MAKETQAEVRFEQYEALARAGYIAYGNEAAWKNFRGEKMPLWEELPEGIRASWRAATATIRAGVSPAITGR